MFLGIPRNRWRSGYMALAVRTSEFRPLRRRQECTEKKYRDGCEKRLLHFVFLIQIRFALPILGRELRTFQVVPGDLDTLFTARWPVYRLGKVLCREIMASGEAWLEFRRLCVNFGRSSGRSFWEAWLQPSLPFFGEECDYGAVTCNTVKIREQYR